MSQIKAVLETIDVPVDQIKQSPYQPRLSFNLEDIRGSIQRDGILVPLTVRKRDGYYELIDGERRLRLAKELGYKTVPCTVIDVDDDTARRMVWKVNTLRQEYTPKEKAYYFKKLQEEYGMSLRGIARECDLDTHTVLAHLNIFKLPEKYQEMVWNGPLSIRHLQELEPMFTKVNEGVVRTTDIVKLLDRVITQKLTGDELRAMIRPKVKEIEEEIKKKRIEAAKEVVREIAPTLPEVKLEAPQELEEVARVLRREARRRKTPEQIREEKIDKAKRTLAGIVKRMNMASELISVSEYQKQIEKLKPLIKKKPDEALSELRAIDKRLHANMRKAKEEKEKQRLEEEMKRRLEEEKKRIEEEALRKAEEKLLKEPGFIRKAAELTPIPPPPEEETLPSILPREEVENLQNRIRETKERIRDIIRTPDVQKRGELFRNWLAHQALLEVIGSAHCPICGADGRNLVWKCHGLNVEEALELAHKKYQESLKGGSKNSKTLST